MAEAVAEWSAPTISDALRRVAALTPAQRAALTRLGAAGEPVTAGQLAAEMNMRASSIRETLDALVASGLVVRQRMPVTGPGRPSFGYLAISPTDLEAPLTMMLDILAATVSVLRDTHPDPEEAARLIGVAWAERSIGGAVPDHARHDDDAYDRLDLASHLDKVAFFFTALGFSARVESREPATISFGSCPFMRDGSVDPLVCHMHAGMTRRIIELTSRGRVDATLTPHMTAKTCEASLLELEVDG
ncbi:MAG: MarR family transcriptional regulator [Mobilicoccus sp.]|nr:MarR family transcriptional regulator [Mobilicoccus sp.]